MGCLARPPEREQREAAQEFVDPDRLPQALAQWEVIAMRVLHAQPPSVRDLAGIAHTEQALLVHTAVIMNAAARAAVIDLDDFACQIQPRLQDAQAAWGDVAASWPAQMTTPAPPSLAGVEASAQLHRSLGDITRNGNGWATPALIASRVHLAEVAVLLRDTVAASGGRAERFTEFPTELPTPDTSTPRLDFSRPYSVTPAGADLNPKVRCAPRISPTDGSSPSYLSRPPTPPRPPATWGGN